MGNHRSCLLHRRFEHVAQLDQFVGLVHVRIPLLLLILVGAWSAINVASMNVPALLPWR